MCLHHAESAFDGYNRGGGGACLVSVCVFFHVGKQEEEHIRHHARVARLIAQVTTSKHREVWSDSSSSLTLARDGWTPVVNHGRNWARSKWNGLNQQNEKYLSTIPVRKPHAKFLLRSSFFHFVHPANRACAETQTRSRSANLLGKTPPLVLCAFCIHLGPQIYLNPWFWRCYFYNIHLWQIQL